jgi:hypothetical protein
MLQAIHQQLTTNSEPVMPVETPWTRTLIVHQTMPEAFVTFLFPIYTTAGEI